MSTGRRHEPMGGENDGTQVRVPRTTGPSDSSEEIESLPPDSFEDDLTLRVRSLLGNFDKPPPRGEPDKSSSKSRDGIEHQVEPAPLIPEHESSLCSDCSQLGIADGSDVGNPSISRTRKVVVVPQVDKRKPAPTIVLTETEPVCSRSFSAPYRRNIEHPPSYHLFSANLNENHPVGNTSRGGAKSKRRMLVEAVGTDSRRHQSAFQNLPAPSDGLNPETERSWSEIIVSAESFPKLDKTSRKPFLLAGQAVRERPPKQLFLLPKGVTQRDLSPRRLTGEDAPDASAIVDKEYEFLNCQSLSSVSDFDSMGRETPPLSAYSIGSSKRLEWDNGADIGYSIANVNSKLKRMVPNTARSEPEGISLINETLNNTATTFPGSSFQPRDVSVRNSVLCDTRDDLDRSSSPEASLSRSDSKRSVIYNSLRDVQSKSSSLNLLEKVVCTSFKNTSCPDLTSLTRNEKEAVRFGALSKSDEVVGPKRKTKATLENNLKDSSGGGRLEKHHANFSQTHNEHISGEHLKETSLPCCCQPSHGKESRNYNGSESERSRDEFEETLEMSGGDGVYHIPPQDEWIDETHVFDPNVHYIAEMSELPADCHIDPRSFLLLSNKMNGGQLSGNVGNLLSIENPNDCPLESEPHIRWYPFSSVNAQDIKNVSTQTAMSYIARQMSVRQPVQVASEQQTSSPEATRSVSETGSDGSVNRHQEENPPCQFNSFEATRLGSEASSDGSIKCHQEENLSCQFNRFEASSKSKATRLGSEACSDGSLKHHQEENLRCQFNRLEVSSKSKATRLGSKTSSEGSVKPQQNENPLGPFNPFEASNRSYNHSSSGMKGQLIHTELHTSDESSSRIVQNPELHASTNLPKSRFFIGNKKVSYRTDSDHEDILIHKQSKSNNQLSLVPDKVKASTSYRRSYSWVSDDEHQKERSNMASSPEHERKLGVGQCETVSRSGEESTLGTSSRPKESLKNRYSHHSSSDSDAINCTRSGGISNSDGIPDSDSSTRSSVEGYSSGGPRNQFLLASSAANLPAQRYYFTKMSPHGDGRSEDANHMISGPMRSGGVTGDSDPEMSGSGYSDSVANQEILRSKPVSSVDIRNNASDSLHGLRAIPPNFSTGIDDDKCAISDSKVNSTTRRLDTSDLYSQNWFISRSKGSGISENLPKSNSDPLISTMQKQRKKLPPQIGLSPFGYEPSSVNERVTSKTGPTHYYSTDGNERLGSKDHRLEVTDDFQSSKQGWQNLPANENGQSDFVDVSKYNPDLNSNGDHPNQFTSLEEDCRGQFKIARGSDLYDSQRGSGVSSAGVLLRNPLRPAVPSSYERGSISIASPHDQHYERMKSSSTYSKSRAKGSRTNPSEFLRPSKSGNNQPGDDFVRNKYGRNESENIHSDHPFRSNSDDEGNGMDQQHVPSNHILFGSKCTSNRSHPPSTGDNETDNVRNYLRTFEKQHVSVGVQVSEPARTSCSFCGNKPSSRHSCYQKEAFKDRLSHVLEEKLDPVKRHGSRSGATFCVFSSTCVCCCSKTLQEAFSIHRPDLAERMQARKKDIFEQGRKKYLINITHSESSKKKDTRKTHPEVSQKEKSYNKENKSKPKRNFITLHVTATKQKERQRTLSNYNRIISKIYSQRLKNEILKGKVNFNRHENLIAY